MQWVHPDIADKHVNSSMCTFMSERNVNVLTSYVNCTIFSFVVVYYEINKLLKYPSELFYS